MCGKSVGHRGTKTFKFKPVSSWPVSVGKESTVKIEASRFIYLKFTTFIRRQST